MSNVGSINLGDAENTGSAATPFSLSAASLGSAAISGGITMPVLALSGSLQGPSELPEFTLSATGLAGPVAVADAYMPGFTADGVMSAGKVASGAALLPGFTLAANTGTRASLVFPFLSLTARGVVGQVSKGGKPTPAGQTISQTSPTLPPFSMSAGVLLQQHLSAGDAQLDPLTLSASAIVGAVSSGDATIRPAQLAATAIAGSAPAGNAQLPGFTLFATTADGAVGTASISLPGFDAAGTAPAQPQPRTGAGDLTFDGATLVATMLPGGVGTGSMSLREPTLDAFLANSPPMSGDVVFAEFTLAAGGLGSNAASAVIRLDEAYLSASGLAGNVGTADITLPLVAVDAETGILFITGTADIQLPVFALSGRMSAVHLASVTFTGIALNSRTKAVSEYVGLAPNSIASFQGVTLMATPDGIVALQGTTDVGEAIDAHVMSGKSDLNDPTMKRALTGYVGLRAEGDLEMTMIADDHHEYVYQLQPRRENHELHQTRVKFGRGVDGVYWQWKIANVDGGDFALDRVELLTASTGNKV